MTQPRPIPAMRRPVLRALVLGGGDVGSAVAHQLFRGGAQVLICDRPQSTHARRGMAFTDALYDGVATLDGVEARWCPDIAAVQACWDSARNLPIVTLAEEEVLRAFSFDVLVEATMRRIRPDLDLRTLAPMAIGIGPGHVPGANCHIAIETQWGEAMGRVLRDEPAAERSGGPRALDGVTRERFVIAARDGTWRTQVVLGARVAAGELLGHIEDLAVKAPISGTLRGITRDGATVLAGQRILEVDPRRTPEVHGLGERPRAIAAGVAEALGMIPATLQTYGDCREI